MKKILFLAIGVAVTIAAFAQNTQQRGTVQSSRFTREALTNETAAQWRAKIGVTTSGSTNDFSGGTYSNVVLNGESSVSLANSVSSGVTNKWQLDATNAAAAVGNSLSNRIVESSQPAYTDPTPATIYSQWEHAGIILTNGDATDPALSRIHIASLSRLKDRVALYYSTWTNKTLTGPINEGRIKMSVATNFSQFNAGKLGVVVSPSTITSGSYTWVSGPVVKYIDGLWWMTCFAGTNSPATFEGESSAGLLLYSTNGINWTEAPSSPYAPLPPKTGVSWDVRNVFCGTPTKVDDLWYIHYIAYQSAPWPSGGDNSIGYLHYATSTNPMVAGSWVRAVGAATVYQSDGVTPALNLGGNGSIVWLPEQQKWLAQLGYQMATCTNRHPTNFVVQTSWLNTGLTNGSGWDQYWGFSLFEDDGLVGVWDSHPGPVAAEGGDFIRLLRPVTSARPVRATTLTLGTTTITNFNEISTGSLSGVITNSTTGNAATATTAGSAALLTGIGTVNSTNFNGGGRGITNVTTDGLIAITAAALDNGIIDASAAPGNYGFTFRAESNIVVTALGRYKVSGNTGRHELTLYRTNDLVVLGRAWVESTGHPTNQYQWAQLPAPAYLKPGEYYGVTSYENTDSFYQVSTLTHATDIDVQFGVGSSTPRGFSGWANFGTGPVNLKYTRNDPVGGAELVGVNGFPGPVFPKITAERADVGLYDSYDGPALDLAQWHSIRTPSLRVSAFNEDYSADRLPSESNTVAYAQAMANFGLVAAGWDVVAPDDLWFLAVNATNGAVITNMSSFLWTPSAGGVSGNSNVVPVTIIRTNGLMALNTNTFPGGLSNLVRNLATNNVKLRWYTPFRTNMSWLSNEVARASAAGAYEMMVDTTVGGEPWFGTDQISQKTRQIIRTFNHANMSGVEPGNSSSLWYTNRGMRLNTGAQANDGNPAANGGSGNASTSVWFSADFINGINGFIFTGEDVTSVSNVVSKAKKTWPYRNYIRPGHNPDFLHMGWATTDSTALYQAKLNLVAMAAASVDISQQGLYRTASDRWVLTNRAVNLGIIKDEAVIPGVPTYSNQLAEIWVRPLGFGSVPSIVPSRTYGGISNAVCFINLNVTNYSLSLNVTNFGGSSNKLYKLFDPWGGTNLFFVNEYTRTISPTNTVLFVVVGGSTTNFYPAAAIARDTAALAIFSPVVSSAAPHFFSEGIQQAAANATTFNLGFSIEPDVTAVRVKYKWVSGLATGGIVHWADTWTTYYQNESGPAGRMGGVNWATNVYCQSTNILDMTHIIPMPETNRWKQLNLSAAASTNNSTRIIPWGVFIETIR